ncbi:hypothetical protein JOF28_000269 [Leucobacter exalbidus]|uniref:Uncharacterized protein n=1 Tax=Leucobacter exalbidus TaxID=662960 RepID=A0A940T2G2_9MICO|nr:hypothetical protein [Leucobacter exalbidus]
MVNGVVAVDNYRACDLLDLVRHSYDLVVDVVVRVIEHAGVRWYLSEVKDVERDL